MDDKPKNDYYDYHDNVAVPFFPRKWLNKFTWIYVSIIIGYFIVRYFVNKYSTKGWVPLSNIELGDISILITLIFGFTFVVGRFAYWWYLSKKGIEIGENRVVKKVKNVLEDPRTGDHQKLEEIRKMVDGSEDK